MGQLVTLKKLKTSEDEKFHHAIKRLSELDDDVAKDLVLEGTAVPTMAEDWVRVHQYVEDMGDDESERIEIAYLVGLAAGLRLARAVE